MMDPKTSVQLQDLDNDKSGFHDNSDVDLPAKKSGFHGDQEGGQWSKLLDKYREKSSVSGVPFITSTKYTVVRIVWTCLLVVACGAMTLHLLFLCIQYFSYNKSTRVDFEFKALRFPAVTVCNANPIRKSRLGLTSWEFQGLVDAFNSGTLQQSVKKWKAEFERPPGEIVNPDDNSNQDGRVHGMGSNSNQDTGYRTGNFFDDFDVSEFLSNRRMAAPGDLQQPPRMHLPPSAVTPVTPDTTTPTPTADQLFQEAFPESWEAASKPSSLEVIRNKILSMYSDESPDVRGRIGHRIQDMLIQCSFDGRRCLQSYFQKDASLAYGNCYTLQNDKFISKRSGPKAGLELIFFLELDEYIGQVANSQGLQVVIHEPGTLPMPDNTGMAVLSGTNTFIGLKMMHVERLGEPYGQCTQVDALEKKYKLKYTRQVCQQICFLEKVWEKCGCYDKSDLMLSTRMEVPYHLPACSTHKEEMCTREVKFLLVNGSRACHCDNPCREVNYKKTVSSRQWPEPDFARLIVSTICQQGSEEQCSRLNNEEDHFLTHEFVKLNIFFEDLNYEKVEENPDYELIQFMSDIGGTIGLWIGLSLLSVFEIFHLLVNTFIMSFFPDWKEGFARRYKYRSK